MGRVAEPQVLVGDAMPQLKWGSADMEGIVAFLVGEKNFNEDRVRKAVERINASKNKSTQGPFTRLPSQFCCWRRTSIVDVQWLLAGEKACLRY